MLLSCTYANTKVNCGEVFESSLTDEGLCCKFNGVHASLLSKSSEK
jgi:Amiloride-sensitive sodium channel